MTFSWQIKLFGSLRAAQSDCVISRFRTQKTAALFAYLAYHRGRTHPREELIDLLWPEADPEAGRHSLSQALSSLRHQFEPPGVPAGAVILADRNVVGLNPATCMTDVAEFEAAVQVASRSSNDIERTHYLTAAVDLYSGDLLRGFYEDWVLSERDRLAAVFLRSVRALIARLEDSGEHIRALDYAHRAVQMDPLNEECYRDLMRLYAASGQPSAAMRQYRELERLLKEELDAEPSAATRELARQISSAGAKQEDSGFFRRALQVAAGKYAARKSSPPPTGTVTILLADLEVDEEHQFDTGEDFALTYAGFDDVVRKRVNERGGQEIRRSDESFAAGFLMASQALAAAIEVQRAIAGHAWPANVVRPSVRIALHTAEATTETEYVAAMEHVERLLLATHGGQILCSDVTATLLRRCQEPDWQLVDLGVFRLNLPERLFQVEFRGMPRRDFPRPKAESGISGAIPAQFTRFFGRQRELETLRQLLSNPANRLLTVTGAAGVGKTRLAIEAARDAVGMFHGAAWFVPLDAVSDAGLAPDAILEVLGAERRSGADPLDVAAEVFGGQRSLLLLDNLEHLIPEVVPVVRALLERSASLTCMVTSRAILNIAGEREISVRPLPAPDGVTAPDGLALVESVQLFLDRVQSARPDFQITAANAAAVSELCTRLEGIPLALELAAARAQVVTPAQVLERIDQRLDFLASRRADTLPRHRSLRAAVDWSFRLLSPELRRFFSQLSVFRESWTLEEAETVTGEAMALDYLEQLRENSMILSEEVHLEVRFRMLDLLRQFAAEHLPEDELARLRQRRAQLHPSGIDEGQEEGSRDAGRRAN